MECDRRGFNHFEKFPLLTHQTVAFLGPGICFSVVGVMFKVLFLCMAFRECCLVLWTQKGGFQICSVCIRVDPHVNVGVRPDRAEASLHKPL